MHQIMDLQEDIHFAQSIIPIKDKIVANAQDFVLPAIFHTPILKHNLFNLPLKKLTKMRIFELPKCEFSSLIERKKNQNKSTLEKTIGQPRMFKVLDVNNSSDVRSVCSEASVSLKLLDFTELEGGAVDVGNGMLVVEDKDTPCMEFCIDVSPTDSELAIPSLNGADQNESQKALKERKRSTDSGISDEGLGNETLQITVDESRETDITFSQDKTLPNSQGSNESGYESFFSGSQSTSMIDAFDSTIVDASRVDLSKYSQEPAELAEDLEDMNSSLNPALRQSNLLDAETQKRVRIFFYYCFNFVI